MIRSTTDEMLAARFDPEPWVTGSPISNKGLRRARSGPGRRFAPRPEFIPTRDPLPWVSWGVRYATRQNAGCYFDPRPEYARPEPNPILVAFREEPSDPADWLGALDDEVYEDGTRHCWHHVQIVESGATPAQIEDARKVLTRIVEVSA